MRRFAMLLLFMLPFILKATSYTSNSGGGVWSVGTTWTPSGHPGAGDIVTITSAVTINANESVDNVTVSIGGVLTINGAGAALTVVGNFTNNSAVSCGTNTVVSFSGSGAQTLGGTSSTAFYNLTIGGGSHTVTLGNNETVLNALSISSTSATLDVSASSSYSLTIGGNFVDNGTFLARSGTVTMNGSSNQIISGSISSITFHNLTTVSPDTIFQALPTTIGNNLVITNGTYDCQNFQMTGSSGQMTMSLGTAFVLGLKSSASAISFPSFTTITLDPTSTVTYQAGANQTVSSSPTYGNLVLVSGPSGSTTKTTSTSSVTVAGSLTINSSTTFSVVSSGTLTLGGNYTNNGTYSAGSTVFDGSITQTLGGASGGTFNNVTINGSGSGIVQPSYSLTISGNLTVTSGTLDVTASNYNLSIDGSFTETGGTLIMHGNTVTMNCTGSQTLGGSATMQLNKLTIGSGTVTLGGTITTTSDITINSGATLSASGNTINIAGNFTDDGTFNRNTGTVYFDKNGNQCVTGTHTSETFQNLTIGALSNLGTTCTVNIDGTILIMPGGLMACVCH